MGLTTVGTPFVLQVSEEGIARTIDLMRYQWPALFNFASAPFFESEFFLGKIAGQPRLVLPIDCAPAVLEKAGEDPRYLATEIPALPILGPEAGGEGGNIPVCAQVEKIRVEFPPAGPDALSPTLVPNDQDVCLRVAMWLGMLADSPSLPAISEKPILLLRFPLEVAVTVFLTLGLDDEGRPRLNMALQGFEVDELEPAGLGAMIKQLVVQAAEYLLPGLAAKLKVPVQSSLVMQGLYPASPRPDDAIRLEFPSPLKVTAGLAPRQQGEYNPELDDNHVRAYLQLDPAREDQS
ncbi:MAG: hypothetical protein ACYC1C_19405 [Chloroflexota bacterium]